MGQTLCFHWESLLPQLAASLRKLWAPWVPMVGTKAHRNTSSCSQNGSSGSWCSSPWSPSSLKWSTWVFATMAICPEMESPPALKAGKTVEIFFSLCLMGRHTWQKTKPILMGHYTGEMVSLEVLTHTWSLDGLWYKFHSVIVILRRKEFLIDLTFWTWKPSCVTSAKSFNLWPISHLSFLHTQCVYCVMYLSQCSTECSDSPL